MRSYFEKIAQDYRALLKELKDKGVTFRFVKLFANNVISTIVKCSYLLADRIWKANVAYLELIYVFRMI